VTVVPAEKKRLSAMVVDAWARHFLF